MRCCASDARKCKEVQQARCEPAEPLEPFEPLEPGYLGSAAPPLDALLALPTAFGSMSASDASVGPDSPRGSRLGPERRNTFSGAVFVLNSTPMKQLLISS